MKLLFVILSFSARLYVATSLSSDGLTLLSLLRHWTFVPPAINSSWNASDSTPCSWAGVLCDHESNVVSLNLTASRISGQLGAEIGHLNQLQTIVLLTNSFSGRIPPELGNCSRLEYIDFSENYFSGHIPSTLKKLQNLRIMSFSSNLLTGKIPESLFQIPHLEEVYLYNNSLSGSIPSNIGNTTDLLKLYLSSNQLSGTIPSSIGNCSKLEALFVNDNRLKGILPRSLNILKHLVYLDVKNNSLGGTIPLGFGSCEKLFILDLSFNVFSGGVPSGLGNCSSLAEISAVKSNLVGSIPSSLGLLHELSILRLPGNHLSGNIPPEIGKCKSLKMLHLYSNQLEGDIPKELGRLSELQDLELHFNHLTGEIPVSIWKIQSLKHILLHNNSLFGELPSELTELRHLKNISLFDNQFSGVIPQNLGINSSLVKLDLMNNKFTGDIPRNLCFGKQLRELNFGLNQLQGGIPRDVGRCATLRRLILNENNLTGPLPEFESNPNLIYMDISKNNINGAIPSSLGNCSSLTALILSRNVIEGLIPSELGNLVNLQVLNLAHNNLKGPLPQQLSYCTKMERFDVGFNLLNGSLPSSLRNWTGLTTLILRENRFSGVIPSFLSEFDQLLEVQLSGNMFGGKIPTSMGAMKNLLYGLNLSANGFTGEVPLEIGKLKKLQSLDLSLNNLTGSIYVLDELSSLIEVNVSYNSFVGPIPKRLMQYLNLSLSSFLGNPGLCVHCSLSDGLSCINTSYLKLCDSESINHKVIPVFAILIIELGSSMLVALFLVKLVHMHLSNQIEMEDVMAYREEESEMQRDSRQELRSLSGIGECRNIDLIYKEEVMRATENLNDRFIIGKGAHGIVYKAEHRLGVFAVKKLVLGSTKRKRLKLAREIDIIRKTRHENVARFLGSWIGKDYGLIFYKYMENGSLHDVLHENDPPPSLDWKVRYKIAIGIAKGLACLHHTCDPPILHRDIKPKNILLDYDMEPCITDFGIAIVLNQSSAMIRMRSTYHLGTPGFMAPEIGSSIVPSSKSDVYSYGVVLLELITRKQVLDSSFQKEETTLVKWFQSVWKQTREIEEIVDPSIASEFSDLNVVVQVIEVLLVALICTEKDPRKRFEMKAIIEIFEAPTDPGILQNGRAALHFRKFLSTEDYSFWKDLLFYVQTKSVLHTQIANKKYFVNRVSQEDRSMYNETNNTEYGTDMRMTIRQKIISSGAYGRGKGSWTPGYYPRTSYASASPSSSNNPLPDVWKTHGYMATPYQCLHDVLHECNPLQTLKWNARYKIAVGIAHELACSHHDCDPPLVHQDISSRNIILDSEMKPHIFPMLLLQSSSPTSEASTSLAQDECTMDKSVVSDVFNYGVVLLELITRKKLLDSSFQEKINLVVWVEFVWSKTSDIKNIVDSSLARELSCSPVAVAEQVVKVLSVALLCTERDPCKRPTMRNVIKLL